MRGRSVERIKTLRCRFTIYSPLSAKKERKESIAMLRRTVLRAGIMEAYRDVMRTSHVQVAKIERYGTDNPVMAFYVRSRWIDDLARKIHTQDKYDLHPSFLWAIRISAFIIILTPCYLVCYDYWNPLRIVVHLRMVSEEQFASFTNYFHWAVVYAAQFMFFVWWHDLSAYVRYPFLAKCVIPLYQKLGLIRRHVSMNTAAFGKTPNPLGGAKGGAASGKNKFGFGGSGSSGSSKPAAGSASPYSSATGGGKKNFSFSASLKKK